MEQRRIRLLLSSLVALVAIQVQANAQHLPRLVVCISVDELRTDYLLHLQPMLEQGGFRRLLESGHCYSNVPFRMYPIDGASAVATIHTGTYPRTHGLESGQRYDRTRRHVYSPLWDEQVQGIYTRDQYSPRALFTPTLADRLKEASEGSALVYSIGVNADAAIAAGGLMPDGCYWLDSKIGAWASSNYYPQMPSYIERYNRSDDGPNRRLIAGAMQWKPLRRYEQGSVGYTSWTKSFDKRYKLGDVVQFKQSPLANEEVTNLALKLIRDGGYQQRTAPGLLALSYTLYSDAVPELSAYDVDSYLRLDADLSRLMEALDKHIGLKDCLIALSGTGHVSYRRTAGRYTKEAKELSLAQSTALLNMYLSANYGAGSWVEKIYAGRVYLNRVLAQQRKVSISELQDLSAQFWREIKGVHNAYSAHQLSSGADTEETLPLKRAIHRLSEADIYWSLLPGWRVKEELEYPEFKTNTSSAVSSPFLIMGSGITSQAFEYPVHSAVDIVRAICWVLRIRPPND